MIATVESYWEAELGEKVEIVEQGAYHLYLDDRACYSSDSLDKVERWLEVYSMVREGKCD